MTCNHCGTQLPDGTAFCPNCGTRLLTTPRPNTAARLRQQKQQEQQSQQLRQEPQTQLLHAPDVLPTAQGPSSEDVPAPKAKGPRGKWKVAVALLLIVVLLVCGAFVGKKLWDKHREDADKGKGTSETAPAPAGEPTEPEPEAPTVPEHRQTAEALFESALEIINTDQSIDALQDDWVDADTFIQYYRAKYRDKTSSDSDLRDYYFALQAIANSFLQGERRTIILPDGTTKREFFERFEIDQTQFVVPIPLVADPVTVPIKFDPCGVFEMGAVFEAHTESWGESTAPILRFILVKSGNEWKILEIIPTEIIEELETALSEMLELYATDVERGPETAAAADDNAQKNEGAKQQTNP